MERTLTKAALYIRVSTEEQALEGQSVDAQLEILKQYCQLYNIQIYNIYRDLGISGKSASNRPGLMLMLSDASKGKFNMVLVWKISRLSRSLKDLLLIIDQLEHYGIVFCSYSERFDTSNAVGRMTLQLLGSIAEFERNTIIDNVKLGLVEYARKGGKTGTVLGYDYKDKQLVVNSKEASAVKLIFNLFVNSRMSMREIADYLNQRGYKTKRNKSFRKDSISVIIRNPVYIGINRHSLNSPNEYQTEGNHEPIIDNELWQAAQKLLETNKHKRPSKNLQSGFILSSKLICPDCRMPMHGFSTRSAVKVYRYYKCNGCGRLIKADAIENKVLSLLHRLLLTNEVLQDTLSAVNHHSDISIKKVQLQNIQKEIQANDRLLERYLSLLEREALWYSTSITDKVKKIDIKLKQLKTEEADLLSKEAHTTAEVSLDDYYAAIEKLFKEKDTRELKRIVELSISCICVNRDYDAGAAAFLFNIGNGSEVNFVI